VHFRVCSSNSIQKTMNPSFLSACLRSSNVLASSFARSSSRKSFPVLSRPYVTIPNRAPLFPACMQPQHKGITSRCNKRCCSTHAAPQPPSELPLEEELISATEQELATTVSEQELLRMAPMKYIEFTCTVCQGRVCKTFSKHSYEKGVVLIRCSGCQNLHLIADNLGFTGYAEKNIEDIARARGESYTNTWEGVIEMDSSSSFKK